MNKVKIITSVVLIVGLIFALFFNEKVEERQMITEWERPKTLSNIAWEYEELIQIEQIEELKEWKIHKEVVIEQSSSFKSYMPYTAIRDTSSNQYKVRELAYTSEYGLRKVKDRFCVAVGTAITSESGTYIDIVLKNRTIIPCVVGDIKADVDTNSDNITTSNNGCVCEFIVDKNQLPYVVRNKDNTGSGNISHCYEEWISPVEKIIVYERNVFDE